MTTNTSINEERLAKFFQRSLNALPGPYLSALPNHLSIVYFVVSGLDLLNKVDVIEKEKQAIIDWVYSRQILPSSNSKENIENCGFRGFNFLGQPFCCEKNQSNQGLEAPLEYDLPSTPNTYCALLILKILGDDFSGVNKKAIIESLKLRQRESDGAFSGSPHVGDYDLRHLFTACAISFILDDWSAVNKEMAIKYILSCLSYEFAFGQTPQQEAHGGPTYCAISALCLMNRLDVLEPFKDKLVYWLIKKQITGFCGRTNKDPDTCYAFWVGASLTILNSYHLVDFSSIDGFIASAQHDAIGGISKEPGHLPDIMHSYLSLSGLSFGNHPSVQPIIPALGLSQRSAGQDWVNKLILKK